MYYSLLIFVSFMNRLFAYDYPFQDPSLPWNTRVNDVVQRLKLEEVAGLTVVNSNPPASVDRLGIHPYKFGTECLRGVLVANSTSWPQSIGIAATFSRDVVYNMTVAISEELRARYNDDLSKGVYGDHGLSCFSPVINIMRHPLWGRNQETYGEDPYLSGELVRQYVRGLQGDHPRYVRANAGCKHFDVHGGPENIPVSRFSFDSKVSERDWRMTFLPQFKACVEAGTYNLMCSYNSINGVPACANEKLLTDILRKEWNFTGYVISDDDAIRNIMVDHKYTQNKVDTVAASIKAGCNMELTDSESYFDEQVNAVTAGKLTEEEVRNNIKPVFYTRFRLGEFDPQEMNPYSKISTSVILSDAHRELATKAAVKSFVLLKNEFNYLPLRKKYDEVAIVGPFAEIADVFGDYSAKPDKKFISTPLDGLKRTGHNYRYAAGCNSAACDTYNATDVQRAVKGAQFVFVCLGTGSTLEAEGHDRSSLELSGKQLQVLEDAIFFSKEAPLVLLLFNAGPLDITFGKFHQEVNAIVACGLPAMMAGEALYRMVTMADADSVPAGRLPATWPANLNQIPPITNYTMQGRTYRYYEGDPLYPFGYGLSYSKFTYNSLKLNATTIKGGESISVTVEVKNRGPYDAEEVVQLYLSWYNASVPVPRWQLVAFDRQMVRASHTRSFSFILKSEQMAVWVDETAGWQVEPGVLGVHAGGQQPFQRTQVPSNHLLATFTVTASDQQEAKKPKTTKIKIENKNEVVDETLYFKPMSERMMP